MRQRWTKIVVVAATLLVLVALNGSILAKERIRSQGERIFLELAPVDPRSLMQGDYMALRFAIASQIEVQDDDNSRGKASVNVDERSVATLSPDGRGSLQLRYRLRGSQVWLGTNAYFFEEGSAARYERARFGEFRVDRDTGEAVLVGLRDAALAPL
ncbi:MAG: GDYXXLXY domain-containing protein [Steroidobacteraceae bacterium]|nr:GDYXXLXY domain-containing protein [Steroidobacteraceae bacterium]